MRVVVIGAGLGGLATALRLQGAGYDVTRGRAAPAPGRARLPAARRRLHVGHGPVADHDAVGARGDVRGGRARPPRRGHAAPARSAVPDPLGRRASAHFDFADDPARLRAEVAKFSAARRRAASSRSSPRWRRSTSRASSARGRRPFLSRGRLRAARADDGCGCGAAAPAARLRRALLRAPARARGVLVPLAVHRRRPVPRAGHLRRARLPPGARRRLVRRRRRLLAWSRRWRARSTCAAASAVEADRARAAGA